MYKSKTNNTFLSKPSAATKQFTDAVGLGKKSNLYYLQTMGIDVWKLRAIKSKILVLIFPDDKQNELSLKAQNLLENMLCSTRIKRSNFELIFVSELKNLEKIEFKCYKAIILMGDSSLIDNYFVDKMREYEVSIIKISHPHQLILRPINKREAYLSLELLQELEFNCV